jgi:hypothetical protein
MQRFENTRQLISGNERDIAAFAPLYDDNVTVVRDLVTKPGEICFGLSVGRLCFQSVSRSKH